MKVIYNNKEVANTTLNYNELFNKPLLNSHELVGNTSLNDIGVYSKPQVDNLIASTRSIKVVSALPTPLVANTMYYVGPDQNNLYHIYLVDSSLTLIDLGMSQDAVYIGGNGIDISSDNEISVVFDNETLMLNSEGELYVRPATENVYGAVKYDNTTIKKNNSGKIYVNNSDTIVGTTDADKIGMTKQAIQKYTDTLVTSTTTGATQIPTTSGTDLNVSEYAAVGNYYVSSNFTASNIANCPTNGNAFKMIVKNVVGWADGQPGSGAGANSHRVREIITYTGDRWIQQVLYNTAQSRVEFHDWKKVLTGDTTASGNRYDVYPYTDNNGITFVGRSIRFVTSGTETGVVSNIDTHASGTPSVNTGNFWVNNAIDSTKSGIMLTTGLVDNKTIKYDGTNTNIYVNNSNTLTGTTDADKIGVTKDAIQKYTYKATSAGSTKIPDNSDLNTATFTKPGNYYVDNNSSAQTLTNCPTTGAFKMFVDNQLGTDDIDLGSVPLAQNAYRIRTIENLTGRRWTQWCAHNANSSTLGFGPWVAVLNSDWGLPFVLSGKVTNPAAGEGNVKNAVNYQNEVVKIGRTGSGTGLYFRGAGLARYNTIKASYTFTLPSGGVTLTNGLMSELSGSSTNVVITGMQADGTYYGKNAHNGNVTGTWTITGLIPSYNVYELQCDITWQRAKAGSGVYRWLGTGSISLTDTSFNTKFAGTIHIRGTCADAIHVPCFEFQSANATPETLTYCVEFI